MRLIQPLKVLPPLRPAVPRLASNPHARDHPLQTKEAAMSEGTRFLLAFHRSGRSRYEQSATKGLSNIFRLG
jgi:hypothetical protein